jgi:hypothetical protein
VKHIEDYTEDEIFNIWFTDDEYDEFKKSCKRTVKMMTAGMAIGKDDHDFCCRGLVSTSLSHSYSGQPFEYGFRI